MSVVDVAQQARELELALSIPDGLEVAQLLKGLNIPVSDLHISRRAASDIAFSGQIAALKDSHIYINIYIHILQYVKKVKNCHWIALSAVGQ